MVETIKNALDANQNITPEVKENLLELVEIFNKNFGDVDLSNLAERLKTLVIKPESMFLVKLPCRYNAHTNEILVNLGKFEEADAKHWIMHSLLGVITAKENYYGFDNSDNSLIALNEAYTEMITNYLVGDVENNFFTDDMIITNLISKVIGEDLLYEAYFSNDRENQLREILDQEELSELLSKMNMDHENRKRGVETGLFGMQLELAERYPQLVTDHPGYFYTSTGSEGKHDVENLPLLSKKIAEVNKNHQANIEALPNPLEPADVSLNQLEQSEDVLPEQPKIKL